MPGSSAEHTGYDALGTGWQWAMAGLVAALLAVKLHLIFLQNVNWDEFLFLAKVYAALRGELTSALQTGYVHAFTWLPQAASSEIDQVIAARGVMFVLQVITCGFIYTVGRKLFQSGEAAMVGLLVYLSFSYTVDHGTSFRADPIAACLLMGALWLLVRDRTGWPEVVAAGALLALAGMVTIKAFFYVPTLALAALCLRGDGLDRRRWAELALLGITTLAVFLALYAAHRNTLSPVGISAATDMVSKSTDKLIVFGKLFPSRLYIDTTLQRDPLAWLLLLTGIAAAIGVALSRPTRRRGIGLVGLGLPLATLVFYRNAFPYYYVFMLAAPSVLAAGLIIAVRRRLGGDRQKMFRGAYLTLIVMLIGGMVWEYLHDKIDRTIAQRQIVETVHRMFAEPVPYIDRCSMIASFPKAGFFMSTWGIENYREAGRPIMRDLLVEQKPVFLIANVLALMLNYPQHTNRHALMAEDLAVLRDNFIHHWGAIWVLGKKFELAAAGVEHRFEILVPGTYTVEGKTVMMIDGVERAPGDSIDLASGFHTALARIAPATVTLRWGSDLYRPADKPVADPIFVSFSGK